MYYGGGKTGEVASLDGDTTVVAKRYTHRHLADKVYNDLVDIVTLLETLGVISEVSRHLTHVHDVSYQLTLQLVSSRFTRRANEQQYEESLPPPL